jgi:D-3-phosphoglycerate dehydrogenase / 2-oxoglutarate reductase
MGSTKIFISTSSFATEDSKPLDLLKNAGISVSLNPFGRKLSKDETINLLQSMDGVIAGTESYSRDILEKLPGLRVISRCGAGTDGIDKAVLHERNITLLNTPSVHITAVAELTLAGLLSLSRKVALNHKVMSEGRWDRAMGVNLAHKTVGIIGYGKVGKLFRDLLRGFQCRILVFDPYFKGAAPDVEKVGTLEELFKEADVISLHIPYSPETKNLLSAEAFAKMKPEVMILNTARGGLIDEKALYDFLSRNSLAGAYMDVFDKEPYQGDLRHLSNIVMTPHVGTFTRETRVQMELESAVNLINFFSKNG